MPSDNKNRTTSYKKKEVSQCKNHQVLGHIQNYSHNSALRIKCSQGL